MKVSADGTGVVSRAGTALLREMTEDTGLVGGWTDALLDTYKAAPARHLPGRVLADLSVMIADGGDALCHLATLRDQDKLFGAVASEATAFRVVERVDATHLPRLQAVRAAARERGRTRSGRGAGARLRRHHHDCALGEGERGQDLEEDLRVPPAALLLGPPGGGRWRGPGRAAAPGQRRVEHRLRPRHGARGRPGRAARICSPRPGDSASPRLLARSDSAGATHVFAAALRARGVGFSLGFALSEQVQHAILAVPEAAWTPAYEPDGEPREAAWVAEITALVDLSAWPTGSRLIVRRERPHPGAQFRFTDADGHRFTALITDTPSGHPAALELRNRQHARVEDRIRCGKATGLRNLPCRGFTANQAWLELALTAADLLTWTQALALTGDLARAEPAALRYRLLHVAARLVRTGRTWRLRIDRDWPWATALAQAFARLRAAPWPG